jgi:hypothetical protein
LIDNEIMRLFSIAIAFTLFVLLPASVAAAECEFVLGFKTIRDLIGHDIVGECGANERYNAIGDSVQQTTGGLLVWRKSDNWTAFTDGYRTWINGPNGLEQRHHNERFEWELDYAPGGLSIVNCRTDRVVTFTELPARFSPGADFAAGVTGPSLIELARAAGWYRDGVAYGRRSPEGEALRVLEKIDSNSPHLAEEMSSWDWLFDSDMTRHEWHVAEFIALLNERLPAFVPPMTALPWIRDGIDESEADAVRVLYREALCYDLDFAVQLATAPWVLDGIEATEMDALATVRNHSEGTHRIIPALVQKAWMRDGLTEDENAVLAQLLRMSGYGDRQEEASALTILEMPFLNDSIDQADVLALESLNSLRFGYDRSYLEQVLSHPTLSDGITNSDRVLLSVLGLAVSSEPESHRPELLDVLLNPALTSVEVRVIQLPRAGETTLAVVHTRPGSFRTLDILETTVRAQEEFMLEAFPSKSVVLLVADLNESAGGGPFGRPFIDPGREEDAALIGHEVGHTYWLYGSPWVYEGGAIVLELAALGLLNSVLLEPFQHNCGLAGTLSGLERVERELLSKGEFKGPGYVSGICPYDLGWALYRDLMRGLGVAQFREGFHRLYVKLRDGAHGDECTEDERNVCYMKFAFVHDSSPQAAAVSLAIINQWYYGSPNGPELPRPPPP